MNVNIIRSLTNGQFYVTKTGNESSWDYEEYLSRGLLQYEWSEDKEDAVGFTSAAFAEKALDVLKNPIIAVKTFEIEDESDHSKWKYDIKIA